MKKINIFLFLISLFGFSQKYDKESLQKRNNEIRIEIKKLNEELLKVKTESRTSILYFTQLTKKIDARTKLINNTSKEKRFIEDDIYIKQLEINKLKRELGELRKEYGEVLISSYKNKSVQNKMLFILTSKDLGQALRRLKYLEKYGEYQRNKSNEIIEKQNLIVKSISQQEKAKLEKETLLVKQQQEIKVLDVEKNEKEKIVQKFKNDENGIQSKLREKQKVAANLNREIENAIKEEIALAKAKREAELKKKKEEEIRMKKEALELAKKEEILKQNEAKRLAKEKSEKDRTNKSTEIVKTSEPAIVSKAPTKEISKPLSTVYEKPDEMELISESFTSNKKRLPWPVDGGTVVSRFGSQPHPIIPNITMNNAGIEIATTKGNNSRAVFQGEVFKIQSIPGGNKAVMINHGDYYTIYTNLQDVYVKTGDKVSARQNIGKIYTDDSGNTLAGFQMWKGTQKIDPALWLVNM